jgi:hypothetical protein
MALFALASLARKEREVVYFSGFARKINNISFFCERSELWQSYYEKNNYGQQNKLRFSATGG